jgi:hypothetical protein
LQNQLKWIKDLNVRSGAMKLLEENRGNASEHWNKQGFWISPKHRNKSKNGQIGLNQTKNFCTTKETIRSGKTAFRVGENICKLSI